MIDILFEDKNVVVCVKPVGLTSQGEGKDSVITALKAQLNCDIFPVHRLDQVVSGLMVYAKNAQAAGKISGQMNESYFKKEYYAVISGKPEKETDELMDYLFHDKSKNKSFVVKKKRAGVKDARLLYNVIDTVAGMSLVRVKLFTGRTHQIRVQFSSRNMPLVGDGKYGSKDNKCECALFSTCLSFKHPFKKNLMEFNLLPPDSYPWNLFQFPEK